jgi:hypothetical protein
VSGGSSERLTTHFDFRKEPEQITHDAQILCAPQAMTAFGAKRAEKGKAARSGSQGKRVCAQTLEEAFALPFRSP